jgi:hypothetical protein
MRDPRLASYSLNSATDGVRKGSAVIAVAWITTQPLGASLAATLHAGVAFEFSTLDPVLATPVSGLAAHDWDSAARRVSAPLRELAFRRRASNCSQTPPSWFKKLRSAGPRAN